VSLVRRAQPPVLAAWFVLGLSVEARADVASWMYVGGGAGLLSDEATESSLHPALAISTGLGTLPEGPVSVGGLLSIQPYFGAGTDFALLARLATRGYVLGDWGLALDVGGYQRWWGVGSTGGQAGLSLGAPWGLVLTGLGSRGTHDARTFAVTLGIDFARLTVYRTSGTNWWHNPFPAVREEQPRR
jgi:hypothetical protein